MAAPLYLGIDVGTASARAGIFTPEGALLGHGEYSIRRRKKGSEQSSTDIWISICKSVQRACSKTGIPDVATRIEALGVDATCSLVVVDETTYEPRSVVENTDPTYIEDDEIWNIIMWLDHRALKEAQDLNEMKAKPAVRDVLRQFGGKISPENEPPKLLWLKRNLPSRISTCAFFDLADWVTFKCTGDATLRSSCTVSCKWGWGATAPLAWNEAFWDEVGLGGLAKDWFAKIGQRILQPGEPAGQLSATAAAALGLRPGVTVATGLIDAHCAAAGTVGARGHDRADLFALPQRLALAAGTSSCMIALTPEPVHVQGVWGPFPAAVLASGALSEAGQSASGALLAHVVRTHAAYPAVRERVGKEGVFDELDRLAREHMQAGGDDPGKDVHVLDSFKGNRSPLADPTLRGIVAGLTISEDENSLTALVALYRAALLALCYGTRLIVQRMNGAGHDLRAIFATGGLTANKTFLQELADVCGIPVFLSRESEATLLGGAIIAASAHSVRIQGGTVRLQEHMERMSAIGIVFEPNPNRKEFHRRKYAVYVRMYDDYKAYQAIMNGDDRV